MVVPANTTNLIGSLCFAQPFPWESLTGYQCLMARRLRHLCWYTRPRPQTARGRSAYSQVRQPGGVVLISVNTGARNLALYGKADAVRIKDTMRKALKRSFNGIG